MPEFKNEKKEKCGVFGVVAADGKEVAHLIYEGLLALQHRGQESAGISVLSDGKIITHRGMGVVLNVFDDATLDKLAGSIGIGHTRYSTCGTSIIENAQPFTISAPRYELAVALNGNITNYDALKSELQATGEVFTSTTDTELIARLFSRALQETDDIFEAMNRVMGKLDGSYSLLILTNDGRIICVRDPLGFKPLCIGKNGDGTLFVASETCALDSSGAKFEREIESGEMVILSRKGIEARVLRTSERRAHCMFEYVYFARGDSYFENIPIYAVRERLGRVLARLYPVDADVVVPIPDSGRSAATGYSLESKIPMREGLMKNRYIFRTFILPQQQKREYEVKLKLNPMKEIVAGKRVVLVDDSIVRGTTIRNIVKLLKDAGALEAHLRITCPPIISPCYMGIDFPTHKELIAANLSVEEIRKKTGADTLGYMTLEGLVESIGLAKTELCMACLTGEYPIKYAPKREIEVA